MITLVPEFPAVDYQSEMIFLVDRFSLDFVTYYRYKQRIISPFRLAL